MTDASCDERAASQASWLRALALNQSHGSTPIN